LGLTGVMRFGFYLAVLGEIFQQAAWMIVTVFLSAEKMEYEAMLTMVYRIVSVTGVAVVAAVFWFSESVETAFVLVFGVMALAHLSRVLLGIWFLRHRFQMVQLRYEWKIAGWLLRQMWVMGIATFCTGLSLRVDIYFLKVMRGPDAVSIFHVPHMFILQVQIIAIALVTALFPVFSRWGGDALKRSQFHEARDLSVRILTITGLWITTCAVLFSSLIVRILGGDAFLPAYRILEIIAWCIPVLFLNFLGANLLTSLKKQQYLIYGAVISLLSNCLLDYLLIPIYGELGAAWATIFSYLLQLVIVFGFLRRFSEQPLWMFRSVGCPFIIAAGITFAGLLFRQMIAPGQFLSAIVNAGLILTLVWGTLKIQPDSVKVLIRQAMVRSRH